MRPLQSTPLPFTSGAIHNYLRNLLPPSKYYDLVLQNESDFWLVCDSNLFVCCGISTLVLRR